jgi:DNA-binding winged helix-turn-helix (wHTH) protein
MKIGFGAYILDMETRQLRRGRREIHLTPKAYDLLATLVSERPNVLSKATLQERIWPEAFVAEANLSNLIAEIRNAIDDNARHPLFIRTAHGFGYAFCGEANDVSEAAHTGSGRNHLVWLQWGKKRFPLGAGTHVIGRDADLGISLDAPTVSRRHAQLVVSTERTTFEDLGSKNGTFRDEQRVTSPVTLVDGDTLRVGSLLLTYHARGRLASTVTATASQG